MPPAPALCICMPQGRINRVLAECTQKSIFSAIHHCSTNATVELAEAKKSGSPVILLVHDSIGHDAIKFMCADVHATPRQVQWIYSLSTGVDPYKLPELLKELANIPVYNARKCHGDILAEHVLFSMLHFNRQPWRLVASKAAKLWDQYNMVGLRGQKVGIFGYGDIGRACGRAAAAMGMEVTGIRRTASDVDVDEYGVRVRTDAAADEVIRTSDFIVGVLPGTPSTVHFFNRDFFSRMKPSAVFINIGRGASQCEDDLVQALQAGTIRGAALDVFEKEPLPESSPLWNLPDGKVLLSPHCADMREDLIGVSVRRFESLVEKYINGASFATEYRVNLEHGY